MRTLPPRLTKRAYRLLLRDSLRGGHNEGAYGILHTVIKLYEAKSWLTDPVQY